MTVNGIVKALIERRFFATVGQRIAVLYGTLLNQVDTALASLTLRIMSSRTPVEKDKIIFLTFRGGYDCNPKWICEEIARRELPYQLVWVYRKKTQTGQEDYPENVRLVRLGTYEFLKELSSARIIIDNGISMVTQLYRKKKDQILIETWHGSLGIKKFSKDANKDKTWIKRAVREGKMTDYIISNSDFETNDVYRVDYWKETPVWLHGHARNDILFEQDTERMQAIRQKIAEMYKLEPGTKICLYAPTFRDDHDMSPYAIDYDGLNEALHERFGGQWVILARFHYRIWNEVKKFLKEPDNSPAAASMGSHPLRVINATDYPDIQELAACTDVAITDYSSWICEYLVTRRPGFMFATDLKEYQEKERPFFFPLTDLPFPVAYTSEELFENIRNFDNEKCVRRCNEFLKRMGSVDDGHAAERTVDEIVKLMEEA